jgi:hypothetical protein
MSAPAEDVRDIPQQELAEMGTIWATVDASWIHNINRVLFGKALNQIRQLSPSMILSSHLPAAPGMTAQLLKTLASVPDAKPFIGPDQEALRRMLWQITQAA